MRARGLALLKILAVASLSACTTATTETAGLVMLNGKTYRVTIVYVKETDEYGQLEEYGAETTSIDVDDGAGKWLPVSEITIPGPIDAPSVPDEAKQVIEYWNKYPIERKKVQTRKTDRYQAGWGPPGAGQSLDNKPDDAGRGK